MQSTGFRCTLMLIVCRGNRDAGKNAGRTCSRNYRNITVLPAEPTVAAGRSLGPFTMAGVASIVALHGVMAITELLTEISTRPSIAPQQLRPRRPVHQRTLIVFSADRLKMSLKSGVACFIALHGVISTKLTTNLQQRQFRVVTGSLAGNCRLIQDRAQAGPRMRFQEAPEGPRKGPERATRGPRKGHDRMPACMGSFHNCFSREHHTAPSLSGPPNIRKEPRCAKSAMVV